eukprot:scaffold4797_cov152-Skeletonema_marinoi.AAC.11
MKSKNLPQLSSRFPKQAKEGWRLPPIFSFNVGIGITCGLPCIMWRACALFALQNNDHASHYGGWQGVI